MTELEAVYWKRYIDKVLSEKLDGLSVSEHDALRISEFAERYMTLVTGQQMLPQAIFRQFLELFGHFPKVVDEVEKAQNALNELIEGAECSTKEVEYLFDGEMYEDFEDYMWLPSMDIDEDGYTTLNVWIDDDGYVNFVNY